MHQLRNFKFSPPKNVVIWPPYLLCQFVTCSFRERQRAGWVGEGGKSQQQTFPYLSCLARNYLSASASSVPVEAMFSTCGLILNQKRSSMAPYRANILSVIHDNYPKFFPINRRQAEEGSAVSVDWVDFDWIATSRNLLATRSSAISTFAWLTMPTAVQHYTSLAYLLTIVYTLNWLTHCVACTAITKSTSRLHSVTFRIPVFYSASVKIA